MNNIFKYAVLNAVRVQTIRGALSAEQLNQLGFKELTEVATTLAESLSKPNSDLLDFLDTTISIDETSRIQFELVKAIIQHKQESIKTNEEAAIKRTQLAEFDALIAEKKSKEKKKISLKKLEEMRAAL